MLTDKKINQLTPKETQYKVAGRDGLYLLVYPTGKKHSNSITATTTARRL